VSRRAIISELEQGGWDVTAVVERRDLVVVIVTFNSQRHVEKCLRPLCGRNVLVVDNASTDSTCKLIRRNFPDVRLIRMSRNLGLSRAFNIGWRQVAGCDILFINPDVVVDRQGIDRLHAALEGMPGAALIAPQLLNTDGSVQHTARTFPTLASALARRTVLGRTRWGAKKLRVHLATATGSSPSCIAVDWTMGAAMLIRGAVLERLRGFDDRYFLYCEDVDFCARAWRRGLQTVYFPGVTFRHEYQRESRCSWAYPQAVASDPSTSAQYHPADPQLPGPLLWASVAAVGRQPQVRVTCRARPQSRHSVPPLPLRTGWRPECSSYWPPSLP